MNLKKDKVAKKSEIKEVKKIDIKKTSTFKKKKKVKKTHHHLCIPIAATSAYPY